MSFEQVIPRTQNNNISVKVSFSRIKNSNKIYANIFIGIDYAWSLGWDESSYVSVNLDTRNKLNWLLKREKDISQKSKCFKLTKYGKCFKIRFRFMHDMHVPESGYRVETVSDLVMDHDQDAIMIKNNPEFYIAGTKVISLDEAEDRND